ncbi:coatomer subunit epsilon [Leishmania donovani]|uniref:Coatomer subunit epsilon n=3 Tax=Leishmania donovani species complex TaxID=38574 RepID=A0A6L0XLX6_LEIIN|nr:putative coatomer epsilon subunit [Leishmania infantum JPCM5]XP_003863597.1 coatomer epsilon subunit, putative [Leishmania donovani]CAC9525078.1 coatomer_subunit_epsilon [Leishmania infantum]AYU81728.1 coatomer subunit epsilon [Leishmania donovani]TPP43692.1 Coatomer epsilon subunit family protein [Leishmania donovani]CAJ1991713.1 coatomer subunit epsilon [Leishmania donovani]CAM70925.1 putative coatomer epsilon subunit [Leishmania infantum JPCM5]|eukprot:XP_001467857.1 putative coatomer epsilon subunit [Leishmania infantum JPCM5]
MTDVLFDVRNALVVGNYHQAIADGSTARALSSRPADVAAFNAEKNAVVALGQIGLGQVDAVISQLRSESNPLLVTIRTWAELICATRDYGVLSDPATNVTQRLQSDAENVAADAVYKAVFATTALLYQQDVIGALTLAKKWLGELPTPEGALVRRYTVELHGVAAEALLRLNRPDEAAKEVKRMEQVDSEAIVTILYSGIVSLHQAASDVHVANYNAAVSAFKEVQLRCGQSIMVSNLMALAHMGLKDYDAAERSLLDALAVRSNDEATLVNLAAVSAHKAKSLDDAERYIQQAASMHGTWGQAYHAKERNLDEDISAFMLEE